MPAAPFVWTSLKTQEPQTHAYFRREVVVNTKQLTEATLHLFADTNYHLKVNGKTIGYGPARTYPEFPEYDSYDLTPHLQDGENVIAVHVLYVGVATFHNFALQGGFCAWGAIEQKNALSIELSTDTGWLCAESPAYDRNAPKFSFAIPPIQLFDERLELKNWAEIGKPGGIWNAPVRVDDTSTWGELRPRTIPHLTQNEKLPTRLVSAHLHLEDEAIYSFRMTQLYERNLHNFPDAWAFAYTYIHSEKEQTVTIGTYWGEHYLNGQKVRKQAQKPEQFARSDAEFDLKPGWNFYFLTYRMVHALWEFQIGVPKAAGLVLSSEKNMAGHTPFRVIEPQLKEFWQKIEKQLPAQSPDAIPELAALWKPIETLSYCASPCRGLAWSKFGPDLQLGENQTQEIRLEAGKPTSLIFDLGSQTLGRIFADFDAQEGTIIDIGYAEDLRNGRPNLYKMVLVQSGERHIAAGGAGRFETFAPRGSKYLQLAVRNHRGPVTVKKVGMIEQVYPYERKGEFECSDASLNRLYAMGWNTLRVCSEDVFTDCPWRERTMYGGDLLAESATALVMTGDSRLIKRSLEVFLQSQDPETGLLQSMAPMQRGREPLSDYPFLVLLNVRWHCQTQGDREFAERAYPVLKALVRGMLKHQDAQGVFTTPTETFIDWISIKKKGQLATFQALMVRALLDWGALLNFLGREDEAAEAGRLSSEIRAALQKHFWNAEVGAFADELINGQQAGSYFIASSIWPMLWGLTTPAQDEHILKHVRSKLATFKADEDEKTVSSYGVFFLLGALYEKGQVELAENTIRQLYRPMLETDVGTIWEHFGQRGSLAHAWSTAPNYYLATRTLGVRLGFPENPNPNEILIAPEAETIPWARGKVPHPLGIVSVDWKIEGNKLLLNYDAPCGAKVRVAPKGKLVTLETWVNGKKI